MCRKKVALPLMFAIISANASSNQRKCEQRSGSRKRKWNLKVEITSGKNSGKQKKKWEKILNGRKFESRWEPRQKLRWEVQQGSGYGKRVKDRSWNWKSKRDFTFEAGNRGKNREESGKYRVSRSEKRKW
jgi:hypothetical protein